MDRDNSGIKGNYDYLTGLPGMNLFFEQAESALKTITEEGKDLALIMFDLCGMKQYNIQYGFKEGDILLKAVAGVISKVFPADNCCRFGGDRFASFAEADGLEDRIKEVFKECRDICDGKNLPLRVGIYLSSMGVVSPGIACDRAKMACDINKNSKISVFSYFDTAMLEESEKQQYIIDNLDKAIKEKWIQVYYQPLIRSANGRVCDEEALARWIDPVKGFMSPADFIPVLEKNKLIYKLDLFVTEQVLEKMERLKAENYYIVPCSINISRSDFESCDIVEEIRKRVEASDIDSSHITIEITESIIGGNVEYMKHQVERFHELGFKVWMDDYGSGYSSPEILMNIPFDTIKLDMQFMRQFDKNEKSRIIINGLIKMAIGLGMETVAEGVETEEQVEFLKEAGCNKLQGFYFCKPIPLDEIIRRYKTGNAIGFENTDESGYYSAIGSVNLYDLSLSSNDEEELHDHFNTMPMAVIEYSGSAISTIRSNKSFRDLMEYIFSVTNIGESIKTGKYKEGPGALFLKAVNQCSEDGRQIILDEKTRDGKNIHALIRRVAVNPVKNVTALCVAILEITDETQALTYVHVAKALASDYVYIYYVDLETEDFIEYKPNVEMGDMLVERHGEDFFNSSRKDALSLLHKADRESFVETFTKENVMRSIDENGTFTYSYRLLINDEPVYVNMKAIRIGSDGRHIVIGVNNVDAQMRQQEALERLKEERITYSRINALSGNYIVFYTVNPYNDHYFAFSATSDYASLGVSKEGDSFFEDAIKESRRAIYEEDWEMFEKNFTKENVFKKIQESDVYIIKYRLMIGGKPLPVRLKAALVNENGRQQLIIGVSEYT